LSVQYAMNLHKMNLYVGSTELFTLRPEENVTAGKQEHNNFHLYFCRTSVLGLYSGS
jgi:hypothetical protein